FPGLEIRRLVGRGGMAAVYEAVQTKLERKVALKVMLPALAQDEKAGERFLREARALASLSHPNVLGVHEVGESGGWFWMITEFVDGANLRQIMELGRSSPAEALRIIPQICEGLQYAHERGVVHRDLKPENVLVDAQGNVKLADFGLAKVQKSEGEHTLTRASMVFGTPAYMAPEQWRGAAAVDHRADIYSLGVMLYELLTGELPVGRFEPASTRAGVAKRLDRVIDKALATEPAQRYQSARELERDVQDGVVEPAAARDGGASPWARVRVAWLSILACGVLLASLVGLLSFIAWEANQDAARQRAAVERERHAVLTRAIAETVGSGRAWTGELPGREHVLATDGGLGRFESTALAASWALTTVVVVTLLGLWSLRRLRASGGGVANQVLARILCCLPAALVVDVGVFLAIDVDLRGDTRRLAIAAAILAILVTHLAVLQWILRESRKPAPPSADPRLSRASRILLGLGSLALVSIVAVAFGHPRGVWLALRGPVPQVAREFLHRSVEQVLEELGPPWAIRVAGEGMVFEYRGLDGQPVLDALQFQGRHVEAVADSPLRLVGAITEPGEPALGLPVERLFREFGAPLDTQADPRGVTHRLPHLLRVVVAHGVVVEVLRE
ncbi:MAG: serine/threonine protein kinase, partial [Planctomycetes bacterium]|nr:serine/threonine protein kinase [Planctomycetota bacterium]